MKTCTEATKFVHSWLKVIVKSTRWWIYRNCYTFKSFARTNTFRGGWKFPISLIVDDVKTFSKGFIPMRISWSRISILPNSPMYLWDYGVMPFRQRWQWAYEKNCNNPPGYTILKPNPEWLWSFTLSRAEFIYDFSICDLVRQAG